MFGRTLDVDVPVVARAASLIEAQLVAKRRRVVVVGHSQGGIILSNVVHALLLRAGGDPALAAALPRLEVYSFCSAADDSLGGGVVFAEHFAAQMDFVARVGVLHFSGKLAELEGGPRPAGADEWNGEVHVLAREMPGQGHLMKEMVLPVLVKGPFWRASRFYRRYFKDSKEYLPVSHVLVERDEPAGASK
jgi:acetyl esterase/lipase